MSKKLTNKTAQFQVSSLTIAVRISLFLNSKESCWHDMKKSHLHLQDAIFDKEQDVWFHFSQDQPQLRNVVSIQQHGSLRILSNCHMKLRDDFKISIKVIHWQYKIKLKITSCRGLGSSQQPISETTPAFTVYTHPGTYF